MFVFIKHKLINVYLKIVDMMEDNFGISHQSVLFLLRYLLIRLIICAVYRVTMILKNHYHQSK